MIARIGATPVPPAIISTSRPALRSTRSRPIGGPIRPPPAHPPAPPPLAPPPRRPPGGPYPPPAARWGGPHDRPAPPAPVAGPHVDPQQPALARRGRGRQVPPHPRPLRRLDAHVLPG